MPSFNLTGFPSQSGKVAIVTGANAGLGYETVLELARLHMHVVLACRNHTKATTAIEKIKKEIPEASVEFIQLDLSSLASVREFAVKFLESHDRLDLLINNAGVMAIKDRLDTVDGFEMQLGVNHLGHFLLTGLLLPLLQETEDSRVVSLSSIAHKSGTIHFDDIQLNNNYTAWKAYNQSKVACILFALELDRRLKASGSGTISVAAHPGLSSTELKRHIPGWMSSVIALGSQSAARGAIPTLHAALGSDIVGGNYTGPDGFLEFQGDSTKVKVSKYGQDKEVAHKLWEVSEKLTGFEYSL